MGGHPAGQRWDGATLKDFVWIGIGFLAIAVAAWLARGSPATGYESSVYTATPTAAWVGIVTALVIGVALGFTGSSRDVRFGGLALATTAVLLVVCLPLVRGYYYLGEDDGLTHLGYARDIASGVINPTEILYPAIHLHAIALTEATGYPLESSLLLIGPAFVLVFVLGVGLTVRTVVADRDATAFGVVAALCLLPINGIAVHLQAHPSSMAILYLPVILLAIVLALEGPRPATLALVAIVSPTYVLIHPLHATNVVSMALAIGGLWAIVRLDLPAESGGWADRDRRVVGIVALGGLATALIAWVVFASLDRVGQFGATIRYSLLRGSPADTIIHYLGALGAIDAGIGEMFVKLFLISSIFILLAAWLAATVLRNWYETGTLPPVGRESAVGYVIIGLVPVGVTTLLFFAAGVDTFAFRQIGFGMAVLTILGAIALYQLVHDGVPRIPAGVVSILTIVLVIGLLLGSLVVIYPSPYVYQPMGHVPDGQVTGFETAFDLRDDDTSYIHLRSLPHRYDDAIHGTHANPRMAFYGGERDAHAPDGFADRNLPATIDETHYLVVTAADREREPHVFEGLRFDEGDFTYLAEDPNVDRVYSNEDFDLFVVYPSDDEATNATEGS